MIEASGAGPVIEQRYGRLNNRRVDTTDKILHQIESGSHGEEYKEAAVEALEATWEKMLDLIENGGILTTSGVNLPVDLSDRVLDEAQKATLASDKYVAVTASGLRDRGGIDLDSLGIPSSEKVFHIGSGFDQKLKYTTLHNNAKRVERIGQDGIHMLEPFLKAGGNLLVTEAQQRGVPIRTIITPSTAVQALLLDVSETWGAGKIEQGKSIPEEKNVIVGNEKNEARV